MTTTIEMLPIDDPASFDDPDFPPASPAEMFIMTIMSALDRVRADFDAAPVEEFPPQALAAFVRHRADHLKAIVARLEYGPDPC